MTQSLKKMHLKFFHIIFFFHNHRNLDEILLLYDKASWKKLNLGRYLDLQINLSCLQFNVFWVQDDNVKMKLSIQNSLMLIRKRKC